MIDRVTPITSPPTQSVAPMPKPSEVEEAGAHPPNQAAAAPPQGQGAPTEGHTVETAVIIYDSEEEALIISPERRRMLREQLQTVQNRN